MQIRTGLLVVSLSLLSCLVTGITFGEEKILRRYALSDHGSIQLEVPVSWKHELQQSPNQLAPTIVFKPNLKPNFEVLITPFWPATKDGDLPNFEKIKQIVQKGAEHAKLRSVEKKIRLKELKGTVNEGYYFLATDRAPEPEGYKYMTQGTIRVGTLIVMFTILTNQGQDNVITDALSMLKNSSHVNGNAM